MTMIPMGSGHRLRKELFKRAIARGWLDVDEVERTLPPELLTAPERWLLYFSLQASDVELRDSEGRIMTPTELVPEGQPPSRRKH